MDPRPALAALGTALCIEAIVVLGIFGSIAIILLRAS